MLLPFSLEIVAIDISLGDCAGPVRLLEIWPTLRKAVRLSRLFNRLFIGQPISWVPERSNRGAHTKLGHLNSGIYFEVVLKGYLTCKLSRKL